MDTNLGHFRQIASHRGRDFLVTFSGREAVLVQCVSPITGDCRTVWKEGRPIGDLTRAVVGNARMRDPRASV